jgi:hypothetical protein
MICEQCQQSNVMEQVAARFKAEHAPLRIFDIAQAALIHTVYGDSGGLAASSVLYVIRPAEKFGVKGLDCLPVRLPAKPALETIEAALTEAAARFDELCRFVADFGDMGLTGIDYRQR